jgi:uncharacterized membrane protein YhaH (DUF805 family)
MFPKRLSREPFVFAYLAVNVIAVVILFFLHDVAGGRGVVALVVVVLFFALAVRRLHDLDISGWVALVILIPVVGSICALLLCFAKGTQGENRFGPDPLGGNRSKDAASLPGSRVAQAEKYLRG